MNRSLFCRGAALCLCLCMTLCSLTGCTRIDEVPTTAATDVPRETVTETPTGRLPSLELETARNEGPMPENAVSWRSLYYDRSLPEDGYLAQGQAAFYLEGAEGGSVIVLDQARLLETVAGMEPLPRTRLLEERLNDERFTVLFAAFDLAMELGCRRFSFSTDAIRATDVTKQMNYLAYTFPLANGQPSFTCTKDYIDPAGGRFHYMTVSLPIYDREDMEKYLEAMRKAREILAAMPEGLDEAGKAFYLYQYVTEHVRYSGEDYYDETDWNTLYDALILNSTVCTGYSDAIYVLFNLAGIDCLYVTGYVDDKIVFGGHAWNLARVDGQWYVFDATWDAAFQGTFAAPVLFGVSDQVALCCGARTYSSFSAEYAPACDSVLDPEVLAFLPPAGGFTE